MFRAKVLDNLGYLFQNLLIFEGFILAGFIQNSSVVCNYLLGAGEEIGLLTKRHFLLEERVACLHGRSRICHPYERATSRHGGGELSAFSRLIFFRQPHLVLSLIFHLFFHLIFDLFLHLIFTLILHVPAVNFALNLLKVGKLED